MGVILRMCMYLWSISAAGDKCCISHGGYLDILHSEVYYNVDIFKNPVSSISQ